MAIQYLDYGISSIPILDGSVNSIPVHGQLWPARRPGVPMNVSSGPPIFAAAKSFSSTQPLGSPSA